jgi:hypothetical protein
MTIPKYYVYDTAQAPAELTSLHLLAAVYENKNTKENSQ